MTTCTPKKQELVCDARYVLKVWLYGITVIAALGSIGFTFAAGQWKKETEVKVQSLEHRVDKIETMSNKMDTVLILLRSR